MSPEQALGEKVGPRSDMYSLGIIVYELVTGSVPFSGDTPIAVAIQHVNNSPPLPRTKNPKLSTSIEAVVLKALARSPEDRFDSAEAFADTFSEAIAGQSRASDSPTEIRGADHTLPIAARVRHAEAQSAVASV